ncbi:DUF309 domain-containing protein [Brevibacillus ginsengisoli]|uniref:DUF309 domain-containing protein n=1 Tax=Brevibacillus ginsengisoli TaxID=363854 RepID=UPI003CF23418
MYSQRYVDYLIHFHGDRDYFECHEILEEHWKSEPTPDQVWVGLIQLAVGLYHQRRENFSGAKKMFNSSLSILQQVPDRVHALALDETQLSQVLRDLIEAAHQHKPYQSVNLPLIDQELIQSCEAECARMGLEFGKPSDCSNLELLHRHTRRDRSEVINEREQQLLRKRQSRLR